MDRRKFLIGTGSLAAGTAGAIGTGAFSSVTAQREFELTIQPDNNSPYLNFNETSEYAEYGNNNLKLSFQANSQGGGGVNSRANSRFNDVFEIENLGTNDVYVWFPSFLQGQDVNSAAGAASVQFLVPEQPAPNDSGEGHRYQAGGSIAVDELDISWPNDQPATAKPSNPIPDIGTGSNPTGQVLTQYTGLRYPGGSYFLSSGDSVSIDVRFTVSNERSSPDVKEAAFFTRADVSEPSGAGDWRI